MAMVGINFQSGGSSPPIGSPGGTVLMDAKRLNLLKSNIRIGTWNVNSMFDLSKAHNVALEMTRLDIKIMGISDTRWIGSGQSTVQDKVIYFSGNNNSRHEYGVAVMIDETLKHTVKNFIPLSPRVMLLQLEAYCGTLNIIQVYAPTKDKPDEEVEEMYKDIQNILKVTKNQDVTIVMGDLNAKIGAGQNDEWVGRYGLGERNERGDRLYEFCQENSMVITNTLFQHHKRRLYTWTSPKHKPSCIIRNQIDFILIKQRYRNAVTNVKTYPGAGVPSDHRLLVAEVKVRLKRLKKSVQPPRIEPKLLRNIEIKGDVFQAINENLKKLKDTSHTHEINPNQIWKNIKTAILEPCKKYLQKPKQQKRKDWMTEGILKLMEERRQAKLTDLRKHIELKKQIRHECRKAKEEWLRGKCDEMEELERRHDTHNLHKKIKEFTGSNRKQPPSILTDENGNIVIDVAKQKQIWEEYVRELFEDQREENEYNSEDDETGPPILKEEVRCAIEAAKNGKAAGPDEISADVLKLIDEQHLDLITALFNSIYVTGRLPQEWLESTFVTIPKKPNAKSCGDYRTISLMSHTLKIFLKVIQRRIYRKLEENMADTQFGFRNGYSTRDALFAYNILIQRCLDVNQSVYVCFIDYNKAFDKVRHSLLINILKEEAIDTRDVQILKNLYFHQKAEIRVKSETSNDLEIKRGVRQGCVLSPLLFNIYSERIMAKALEEERGGIVINGTPVNNLRYADDTVLLAENIEDLQRMLNKVMEASEEYGLTLNTKKTKFMIITKRINPSEQLMARGENIEKVSAYNYLGTRVNSNSEYYPEIKIRIEKARSAFLKMRPILSSHDLSLDTRVRLLKCYVFPILLYGVEAWTLNKECEDRLQAFEMWAYRRILRISWTDRVTNVNVLRRMGKEVEIINEVKKRKLTYLGHIMRGPKYEILHLIIQGKIMGKRSVGRRRISWLRNLREWFNCSSNELFKVAINKIRLTLMIANLRNGDGTRRKVATYSHHSGKMFS
uniref:Craniofacial development protein 2 n=1 Tax=Cacopsylla melanoneura TaxID=428564 RepID=A0A8D9DVR2_9HEMI